MAEFDWANRGSCLDRVWVRAIAPSRCINGIRLYIPSDGPPDCGRDGRGHCRAHRTQQLEDKRTGEDHQDVRHVASSSSSQLLHHLVGHAKEQK